MAKIKIEISRKRKQWVTKNFGKLVSGTHMSNIKKTRLLKKLWREARGKFK